MEHPQPEIVIIAAMGAGGLHNRGIGKDNRLLWHIKEDLIRFKLLSLGHPVIMGRKTFESIGKPLPGRTNIVVTQNPNWKASGVTVVHSFEEALDEAKKQNPQRIVIGGGTEIYRQALPYATKLCLTLIEDKKEADAFFPPYEHLFKKIIREEGRETPEGLRYRWVDLEP